MCDVYLHSGFSAEDQNQNQICCEPESVEKPIEIGVDELLQCDKIKVITYNLYILCLIYFISCVIGLSSICHVLASLNLIFGIKLT